MTATHHPAVPVAIAVTGPTPIPGTMKVLRCRAISWEQEQAETSALIKGEDSSAAGAAHTSAGAGTDTGTGTGAGAGTCTGTGAGAGAGAGCAVDEEGNNSSFESSTPSSYCSLDRVVCGTRVSQTEQS